MKVKVESCWHGGDRFSYRLIAKGKLPIGVYVDDTRWSRKNAIKIRQAIRYHWGVENIRLVHK